MFARDSSSVCVSLTDWNRLAREEVLASSCWIVPYVDDNFDNCAVSSLCWSSILYLARFQEEVPSS